MAGAVRHHRNANRITAARRHAPFDKYRRALLFTYRYRRTPMLPETPPSIRFVSSSPMTSSPRRPRAAPSPKPHAATPYARCPLDRITTTPKAASWAALFHPCRLLPGHRLQRKRAAHGIGEQHHRVPERRQGDKLIAECAVDKSGRKLGFTRWTCPTTRAERWPA